MVQRVERAQWAIGSPHESLGLEAGCESETKVDARLDGGTFPLVRNGGDAVKPRGAPRRTIRGADCEWLEQTVDHGEHRVVERDGFARRRIGRHGEFGAGPVALWPNAIAKETVETSFDDEVVVVHGVSIRRRRLGKQPGSLR